MLEVGVGSGVNLSLYGDEVEAICGLDPSERLLSMARRRADRASVKVDLIERSATKILLRDGAVDTIVMIWTLATVLLPCGH